MKTALITGANKSIGFESARLLAQQGYHVYLGARDIEKGKQAAAILHAEGLATVEAIQIDVTDKVSIQQAEKTIREKSGVLDVLINNAGILGDMPQTPSASPVDNIRKVFETNVFGVIEVTQVFIDLLGKASVPVIVNVSSGLGSLTLHSDPAWPYYAFKSAAYGPSKTALNAYTVALAHELLPKGFKVNAVDPGYTATDFNNHQGHLDVKDSAGFVVRWAVLDAAGPTGKFLSHDRLTHNNESPW